MLRLGQQVVCIRDSWDTRVPGEVQPIKDMVYTIRGFDTATEDIGLWFEEFVNEPLITGLEPSYEQEAFRPVKDTSIEMFTKMLNPAPKTKQKKKEDA